MRRLPSLALLSCLLLLSVSGLGCRRGYYRNQADSEVYGLIAEKAGHPHWPLERYTIDIDPRSRMYDPFDPDYEPMPPDDPVSHQFIHYVDNKRGYPHWHANGDAPFAENPDWVAFLPVDEDGVLKLDAATAVQLALLHSPDYQQQFETLYLTALGVSSERFRFDTQYFGGYSARYLTSGRTTRATGSTSRFDLSTRSDFSPVSLQARRFFTTGADLVVGLANSLVWNVAGPNTNSVTTLMDFALVQPLLRAAGRDRVMETLTQAERTLLANVRQVERFRRGFYLEVVTGGGAVGGFTVGAFGGGGGIVRGAGGYLRLLQLQQIIRNQETNIAALKNSLTRLEAFFEAGRIDFLQVEQVRLTVFQNTSSFLDLKRDYQERLDFFKQTLGLPPQVRIEIGDDLLDAFILIDPSLAPQQDRITALQRSVGDTIIGILPESDPDVPQVVPWNEDLVARLRRLSDDLTQGDAIRRAILEEYVPQVRGDIDALQEAVPERRERAQQMLEIVERGYSGQTNEALVSDVDPLLFDVSELDTLPEQLRASADDLERRLDENRQLGESIRQDLDRLLERGAELDGADLLAELRDKILSTLPRMLTDLSADVLELSLIQARARAESITLMPVEMDPAEAVEIARVFRRDWMNARANLVDAWRRIEFNADNLESTLDVVVEGDVRHFSPTNGSTLPLAGNLRLGIQFDAPLTRLLERNTYRQSLIDYQQARRGYYQFEDAVARDLRATLRLIELSKVDFELQRRALRVAVAQVRLATLRLQEPPRPGVDQRQAFGPTTAQDLIRAVNALRDAQNTFLGVWLDYQVQRSQLDLNMGTMQLDAEGMWIDPGAIGLRFGYPSQEYPSGGERPYVPPYLLVPGESAKPLPDLGEPIEAPRPDELGPDDVSIPSRQPGRLAAPQDANG